MDAFNRDNLPNRVSLQMIKLYYITIIIASGGIGTMLFLTLHLGWLIGYTFIIVALHIAWLFTIIKLNNDFTFYYYITMLILIFPASLIFWEIQVYSFMLFYVLLPLIIYFHFGGSKYTVYTSVMSMLLVVAIIVFLPKKLFNIVIINEEFISYINIVIIITAMAFVILFFYASHEIFKLKNEEKSLENELYEDKQEAETRIEIVEIEVEAEIKELYNKIIVHFDERQPYRQQNYNLSMLADDLNVNRRQLSEVINTYQGATFDNLLNKYRLEYVKKMLDDGLAEKYTIEYISILAGYSSRSSFYKNFYKAFKISPLDYQRKQKSATT